MLQGLILAGDALIVYLDFPPAEAEESRRNARRAVKEWQRVTEAARRRLAAAVLSRQDAG